MEKPCTVCRKEKSPYKCPKCSLLYCSVACCKVHKETCTGSENTTTTTDSLTVPASTSDYASLADKLKTSTRLQSLLASSPYLSTHLPVLLARIDRHDSSTSQSSPQPASQLSRDLEKKERIAEVLKEAIDTDPAVAELYQILLDEEII